MKRTTSGVFIFSSLFALFSVFAVVSGARAQSTTDGAIGGLVSDPSGAIVPGANVAVRNLGTGSTLTGSTDLAPLGKPQGKKGRV